MAFVLVIAGCVFLVGLVQWARSGAVLWDILKFSKPDAVNSPESGEREALRKKEALQKSLRSMERTMDELLRSSLKVLGVLAFVVWFFVLASVAVDMLNLDWLDRLSFSVNRVLGSPAKRAAATRNRGYGTASSARNNTLRSIGSGVRR